MREFAAVILLDAEGKFILQLRDDDPKITDPGKLSLFAGGVEQGETHLMAAERELFEETTLERNDLKFYKAFHKEPERHGAEGVCHVYVLKDIDPATIDVQEGQGYRLATIGGLTEDNTALISLDILKDYAANGAGA